MVRNHIGLEELGIPGVSIVQEEFVPDAKATGEAYRFLDPPMAVTPYCFTSLNGPQTRQAVDAIIDQIITGLTKPLPEPKKSVVQRITTRGPKDDVLEFKGRDQLQCFDQMNEAFLDWGWSDGFPIIPPTEEKVKKMLGGTRLRPDDLVVENFVPGMAPATVKNIAINAVMAGCKPEFLPVIIAAVKAMHDPAIELRVVTMSTGPHAPFFVVNGPLAKTLQINSGLCALGPAGPQGLSFPNVVIGRAVRLILMNVGNAYPGIMDQDTIGSPAKFSMVLAENERANPWEPYQVEKGFGPEESTVTCFYGHSLTEMDDMKSETAGELMKGFARHLTGIAGTTFTALKPIILLSPDHATVLARDGWTKHDIRHYLFNVCKFPAGEFRQSAYSRHPVQRKWLEVMDAEAMIPLYSRPEDIQIVVAGGMTGKSAAYVVLHLASPHPIKN